MKVVVIGTGYVGLTTGVTLAYLGHKVVCLDIDERKIHMLNDGQVPIYEPGLERLLAMARPNLRFLASYDDPQIFESEVFYISVGTPPLPDGSSNLNYVKQVAEELGKKLGDQFSVIVNKSTVPIGSGNWVDTLIRDSYEAHHGHKPDDQFAVASNPEFLREGTALHDNLYPDRIVVGSEDSRAIDVLTNLYRPILNQDFPAPEFLPRPEALGAVPLVTTGLASAELIKYAANAFLASKISFINDIAQLAEVAGADITQIARGIGLDSRIGSGHLQAGIGWGGSCFGKDTSALMSTAEEYNLQLSIIQSACEINQRQRKWVVEKLLGELKILKGRTIALLGLAFKPHTDDLRDAPAIDIARYLIQYGAKVNAHDPVALVRAQQEHPDLGIYYHDDVFNCVQDADAVVLVTEWPQYRTLAWAEIKNNLKTPLIVDGRNFIYNVDFGSMGYTYIGVGR